MEEGTTFGINTVSPYHRPLNHSGTRGKTKLFKRKCRFRVRASTRPTSHADVLYSVTAFLMSQKYFSERLDIYLSIYTQNGLTVTRICYVMQQ
jgi:hypothetical protein